MAMTKEEKRAKREMLQTPTDKQFSDVFALVQCSRCAATVLQYEGHASAFQQKLFVALASHKRTCAKILKLFPEIPR